MQTPTTSIDGIPPWFPVLAEVMDPAPRLLDAIASAFAPHAVDLNPDVYWTALHCFALDQMMAAVFEGSVQEKWLRQAAWVSYATGFWCTRSWRGAWVPVDESLSIPTTVESVSAITAQIASKLPAWRAGGAEVLDCLGEQLRDATFNGALYGTAYNTSYLIVIGEPPPVGHRPPHLDIESGFVRADANHPLELAYEHPLPSWLAKARSAFGRVQSTDAGLATLWKDAFDLAVQNWGGDFISGMNQGYYDPFLRWSVLYNFGLEAISRAAIVALEDGDSALARQALAGNIIFDGSWGSLVLGVVDGSAPLPGVVTQ